MWLFSAYVKIMSTKLVWHCSLWMTVLCNVIHRRCPWRCVCSTSYLRCNKSFLQVTVICLNYAKTLLHAVGKLLILSHYKLHRVSETGPTHSKCNRSVLPDNCDYSVPRRAPFSNGDLLVINACIFYYLNAKATPLEFTTSIIWEEKRGLQKIPKPVSTSYTEFFRCSTVVVQSFSAYQN